MSLRSTAYGCAMKTLRMVAVAATCLFLGCSRSERSESSPSDIVLECLSKPGQDSSRHILRLSPNTGKAVDLSLGETGTFEMTEAFYKIRIPSPKLPSEIMNVTIGRFTHEAWLEVETAHVVSFHADLACSPYTGKPL